MMMVAMRTGHGGGGGKGNVGWVEMGIISHPHRLIVLSLPGKVEGVIYELSSVDLGDILEDRE